MILSLSYVAIYAVLAGAATFIEPALGRGFGHFQLNVLIRVGGLGGGPGGTVCPPRRGPSLSAVGLRGPRHRPPHRCGFDLLLLSLDYLPVSLVVTLSNLYIVVTIVLGIVLLREPLTGMKILGLAATLVGVLFLAHRPARYGVHADDGTAPRVFPARAVAIMAIYIGLIGIGAFLEKPALKGLDAAQLNALMAIAMAAVAAVAVALRGPPLPMTRHSLGAIGVGATIGVASVFYFLGLRGLPVSVAAAGSNAYIVVTVLLSTIVLRQPLTRASGAAITLTLVGVSLLALATG